MCSFSNYFLASRHNLPPYTPEEFFFYSSVLSAQVLGLKAARQVKEVHHDCTILPWNCWTVGVIRLLLLILHVKQIWKTICNTKASLDAGLPLKYTANGFTPLLLHWENRGKTSALSSSFVPQWASAVIRAFNGKEQLEEPVKIVTHLPAFLCVCVQAALVRSFMPVFISTTHGPTCGHDVVVSQWHRDVLSKS